MLLKYKNKKIQNIAMKVTTLFYVVKRIYR